MQQFVTVRVTACRSCGRGLIRSFTGKTLWQGWWGVISFFFNWFVLAANLHAWRRLGAIGNPSLSGDLMPERTAGFDNVAERPAANSEVQPKRRSRVRTAATVGFLGFLGLGLIASGWDATHHDHKGAHGSPVPAALLDLMMAGAFTAEDGSAVSVENASCTGQGDEVSPGSHTHFDCLVGFTDGTTDDVVVHLLPGDELFFVSSQGSGAP